MKLGARFARFSVVGLAGIVVQLATLAALVYLAGLRPLVATPIAVAAAIVHNFAWHIHWTWRDREISGRHVLPTFARFVGANGLISLAGNTVLTPLIVSVATVPPLIANLAAIATCSVANFLLGDNRVFKGTGLIPAGFHRSGTGLGHK